MNTAVLIAKAVILTITVVVLLAAALVGIVSCFDQQCGDVWIHNDRGHRCVAWGKHKVHRDEYGTTWTRTGER